MFWPIVFVILFVLLCSVAYAAAQGAPWVPTWRRDLSRISALLRLRPGDRFVELGCGNARVSRHVKRTHPWIEVTGVELSILQYAIGWLQNRLTRSDIEMKYENIFKRDLSCYDAIYVFLMPETYTRLRSKFETELKPGSRVVSYVWPIPGWEPKQVDELPGAPKLYYYER